VKLTDLGFWSAEHSRFFTPLLLRVVLKEVKVVQLDEPRVMMIEKSADKQKIIQQLVSPV